MGTERFVIERGRQKEYLDQNTGARFFSVSEVLKVLDPDAFSGISQDVMDRARERGKRIHYLGAFALAARVGHGEQPICEDVLLKPYFDSMNKAIQFYNIRARKIEEPSCNHSAGYAGCPDIEALMDIPETSETDIEALLDWKSGPFRRAHRVQLISYRKMERYEHLRRMFGLYLRGDGKCANLVEVKDNPADYAWFLCGLGVLKGRLNP